MDSRYTYNKLKNFFFDDELCNWVRRHPGCESFNLNEYKASYPGMESEIDVVVEILTRLCCETNRSRFTAIEIAESLIEMHRKADKERHRLRSKKILRWVSSVAVLLGILLGGFFYLFNDGTDELYARFMMNDGDGIAEEIHIIRNGEKTIVVNDTSEIKICTDGSIMIADMSYDSAEPSDKVEETQVVVPRGKRTRLVLPDGSRLWINSGSRILYRSDFTEKRRLFVDGEIFLDVTKDKDHPFRVKTSRFDVEVLGTTFNINDYESSYLSSVVLVEGSVNVKAVNSKSAILKPNEKLDLMGGNMKVKKVDNIFGYICWKDDIINFDGKPLSYILTALAEYYDMPIEGIENVEGLRCKGNLDLNKSLEEVLRFISLTVPIEFSKEKNHIAIRKKNE